MTTIDAPRTPIRTFHPRRGRMGDRQRDALDRLWPTYGHLVGDPFVAGVAPLVLEIGFGMGDATAAMAAADPDRDYLGVEIHTPGIARLLELAEAGGLTNLRVAKGDALELLPTLPELAAIHVFFPDPWPKARHHKRRLIQSSHVSALAARLAPGGILHCATDDAAYASSMLAVLSAEPALRAAGPGSGRPVTKFERRALDAGRPVADLIFQKR